MQQIKKLSVEIDVFQNELVTAIDALSRVYRMYQRPLETDSKNTGQQVSLQLEKIV